MNKYIFRLVLSLTLIAVFINAQGQDIRKEKELATTEVKNQANSGTCWSFATVSMLESELIRMGKGNFDLSEMYFVRKAYERKADRYIRLGGKANFGGGGQAHDVIDALVTDGMMTEEGYSGLLQKDQKHDHMEMDEVLAGLMKKKIGIANAEKEAPWRNSVDSVMDVYMGKLPAMFTYKGKDVSPQNFFKESGLNPADYIELTSFSHHPFYKTFVLEVPDNWSQGQYYNLPLEDLMRVMVNSIQTGYTFAWDGDVSGDTPFSANKGIATNLNDQEKVTQEMRQKTFDKFITTDDHLMHISGIGSDKEGVKYFLTKNSWGDKKGNDGYWWLSENFVRMNTIAIMVNKNALPDDIAQKLGISR
jgi:bleomycin hydrolase